MITKDKLYIALIALKWMINDLEEEINGASGEDQSYLGSQIKLLKLLYNRYGRELSEDLIESIWK